MNPQAPITHFNDGQLMANLVSFYPIPPAHFSTPQLILKKIPDSIAFTIMC